MKLYIRVTNINISTEISIDTDASLFLVNGVRKDIDIMSFLTKLQLIISSWEKTMIDSGVIDGESYYIHFTSDAIDMEYVGNNAFPVSYAEFKSLLSEVV